MCKQVAQELTDLGVLDVLVVQSVVETEPVALGADREA